MQKTIEDKKRDLATLEKTLQITTLPADERSWHSKLAARLRQEIAAEEAQNTATAAAVPPPPPAAAPPTAYAAPAEKKKRRRRNDLHRYLSRARALLRLLRRQMRK